MSQMINFYFAFCTYGVVFIKFVIAVVEVKVLQNDGQLWEQRQW